MVEKKRGNKTVFCLGIGERQRNGIALRTCAFVISESLCELDCLGVPPGSSVLDSKCAVRVTEALLSRIV